MQKWFNYANTWDLDIKKIPKLIYIFIYTHTLYGVFQQ